MKHGLGIAIFSVLSALTLSVLGCGGSGEGMGVLDPYPTSSPTAGPTVSPTPPEPTPDPEKISTYDVVINKRNVYNPTRQFMAGDFTYVVQGFVPAGAGLDDTSPIKYRLMRYYSDSNKGHAVVAPQEVVVELRGSSGTGTLNLQNPFWLAGKVSPGANGSLGDDDDVLYLGVTDLGSTRGVYVISLGTRKDGWSKGIARNALNGKTEVASSNPLTCDFDDVSIFWTDCVEDGKVCHYSYDKIESKTTPDYCHIVLSGLNYPAVINMQGPWGAVSCQGDDRVALFAKSNPSKPDKDYLNPLAIGENLAFLNPSTYANHCPFDLTWTQALDPDNGNKLTSYLAVTSGLTIEGVGPVAQAKDKGAIWLYKDNGASDLKDVTGSKAVYNRIIDGLQYPVSICFPYEEKAVKLDDNGKPVWPYLDMIYARTGSSSLPKNPETPGSIEFLRYSLSKGKVDTSKTKAIYSGLNDPFHIVLNSAINNDENHTSILFTSGWNWGTDTSDSGNIQGIANFDPTNL